MITPTASAETYRDAYVADYHTPNHKAAREAGRDFLNREVVVCREVLASGATSVLDVGCGDGYLAVLMACYGLSVSVLDVVPHAVLHASRLATRKGTDLCSLNIGLLEDFAEQDPRTWGAVTCTEMIEHVRDPKAVVRLLAARAEKVVVLSTPVGTDCDDPLHLWHWHSVGELERGLDLAGAFRSWVVERVKSHKDNPGEVWVVTGKCRTGE